MDKSEIRKLALEIFEHYHKGEFFTEQEKRDILLKMEQDLAKSKYKLIEKTCDSKTLNAYLRTTMAGKNFGKK